MGTSVMPAALIICHVCVLGAATWFALTLGLGPAGAGAVLLVCVAPLLLGFSGLRAGSRYTQQWLAISMVFYFGVGLAETIASQARSPAAIMLLLAGAIELVMLLGLLRAGSPAFRESAES